MGGAHGLTEGFELAPCAVSKPRPKVSSSQLVQRSVLQLVAQPLLDHWQLQHHHGYRHRAPGRPVRLKRQLAGDVLQILVLSLLLSSTRLLLLLPSPCSELPMDLPCAAYQDLMIPDPPINGLRWGVGFRSRKTASTPG